MCPITATDHGTFAAVDRALDESSPMIWGAELASIHESNHVCQLIRIGSLHGIMQPFGDQWEMTVSVAPTSAALSVPVDLAARRAPTPEIAMRHEEEWRLEEYSHDRIMAEVRQYCEDHSINLDEALEIAARALDRPDPVPRRERLSPAEIEALVEDELRYRDSAMP